MSSHDPHLTRARDHGLRRMQAVRRWAVALTTAAALALSGLAWSTTAPNGTAQTDTSSASSSTDTGTSTSTSSDTSSSSSAAPSSTTQSPAVTSGGS